jgi:hypothetical protein
MAFQRNPHGSRVFGVVIGAFVFTLVLFKLTWGWIVPDLFPGALEQGFVSASATWSAAVKVALVAAVVAGLRGHRSRRTPLIGPRNERQQKVTA